MAWFVGDWLIPRLMRVERYIPQKETAVAVLIGILLMYAWSAEMLGSIAAITGAYLLGIIVARHTDPGHYLHESVHVLGYGFFVPIFFVGIELEVQAGVLLHIPLLTAAIVVLAIVGKVVGCCVGVLAGGFERRGPDDHLHPPRRVGVATCAQICTSRSRRCSTVDMSFIGSCPGLLTQYGLLIDTSSAAGGRDNRVIRRYPLF